MTVIRTRSVRVSVDSEVLDWPGHKREILAKVHQLDELIRSLETGRTERI